MNKQSYAFFKVIIGFYLALLFSQCTVFKQTQTFSGQWIGTAEVDPYPELVYLRNDTLSEVKLFYHNVYVENPKNLEIKKNRIRVSIDHKNFKGLFSGKLTKSTIKGSLLTKEKSYECNLSKIGSSSLEAISEYIGYYQFEDKRIIKIEPYVLDASITALSILDYSSGKTRILFPENEKKYFAGPRMLTTYPTEILLEEKSSTDNSFLLNYKDLSLGFSLEKGYSLPDLLDRENISAKNGDVELFGTITFPDTEAPFPLVVYVPGGGEQFRGNLFDDYIDILPYLGIATLIYDKRGCGESTGDRLKSSFDDHAEDLVKLIEVASKNERIDSQKTGLLGFDQASFVMPLAAKKIENLKFVSFLAGSLISLKEQEYHATKQRLEADGFTKDQTQEALEYQQKMFKYLEGKIDTVEFRQISDRANNKPWSKYVTLFSNKPYMNWWEKNHHYNPKKSLQNINVPILAVYGENDLLFPPSLNQPILEKVILENNLESSEVHILEGANHFFYLGEKRGDFQFSEITGYSPRLFPAINNWIVKQFEN